jgi:ABC-2 type transport system permease protein
VLRAVAGFEWRYQSRGAALWISCAFFFLLTFGSVTTDQIQIGGPGNQRINAACAILRTLASLSVFAVFAVVQIVANVALRDDETGFAPIMRATPLRKRDYLLGRFLGACAAALPIYACIPVAIAVGAIMPFQDAERIGAFRPFDYVYAILVFGLPTLLTTAATFFAVATATRSVRYSYVAAITLTVLDLVVQTLLDDPRYTTLAALSDPFGLATLGVVTRYWTTAELNVQLPALRGLLLYNRLLWLGISAGLFALTYRHFRFEPRARRPARQPLMAAEAAPLGLGLAVSAGPRSDRRAHWLQAWALTRHDVRYVLRSPGFLILLGIGLLNASAHLWTKGAWYGSPVYPVTRIMVQGLQESFIIMPILVALYYASDLVWRDRELRVYELIDATAAPDWAHLIPKLIALALVLVLGLGGGVLGAMFVQLLKGYHDFELGAYVRWFVIPNAITSLLVAVFAIAVQVVAPHKFIGWALMLVYLVAKVALYNAGFEHQLYDYAGATAVPLSDMSGTARFWLGRLWLQLYSSAFAGLLVLAAFLLWRRGSELELRPRLRSSRRRMRRAPLLLGLAALALWLGSGAFVFYNTNVLNQYRPRPLRERTAAKREKTLLGFKNVPQPRIRAVKLDVELYPTRALATTHGEYVLQNQTDQPLERLHVHWYERLRLDALSCAGASLEREWPEFQYRIYRLNPALQPGERRTLRFATTLQERGFPNSHPLTRLVENGTFINNDQIAPLLGLADDDLLRDRKKRHEYGLSRDVPVASLEDKSARAASALRRDSDFVDADLTVTTDADQIPIAPGYLESDVVMHGRRRAHFRSDAPIVHVFSIQSGRYAVARSTWRDPASAGHEVQLAVYYHPPHTYNVARMLTAMSSSLALFSRVFSPYQFHQARIIEFPSYLTLANGFANTIPYSEDIGFLHHHEDPEKIDVATYVTAHEIGHQWWGHQLVPSDQQGAAMLTETFAQYSALLAMEQMYGVEQIRRFLHYELDTYLHSRGSEAARELPLVRVERQPYVYYQKGGLVMYWLKDVLGEARLDACLRTLLAQHGGKPAPYANARDFLNILYAAAPEHTALIHDLFEEITLLDVKTHSAEARRRADGKYDIALEVEAHKFYADDQGAQREAPLDELFDVGAFSAEPGKRDFARQAVLGFEMQRLKSGRQTLHLVVERAPRFAGVDPYNKRIDRVSDDNVVACVVP